MNSPLMVSGDKIYLLGVVTLPVTARTSPKQVTFMTSAYNVILGRTTLNFIRAITSTYHFLMRFPTEQGVSELRGDQATARECYLASLREKMSQETLIIEGLDREEEYLSSPPLLYRVILGEDLYLYLAVSSSTVSSTLIREEDGVQKPVYYISQALRGAKERYPTMEKLGFSLVLFARKLRPYFQAHRIVVLTDQPLRQVFHKQETSGRLMKWSIELGKFDIQYRPRIAIKAQVVEDFVAEFTPSQEDHANICTEVTPHIQRNKETTRTLFVDGSSTAHASGVGLIIISPEGENIAYALRFGFKVTNNKAEYEALIAGLKLAKVIGVEQLIPYTDSQLIAGQVAHKTIRQGYYWPTIQKDATDYVKKCDKCQWFANVPKQPPEEVTPMMGLWPFAQWGMNIIGPLPMGKGQVQYAIVAIDYFTKWIEAKPLASIAETNIRNFAWRSIICRFGIPRVFVTDNGKQFDNMKFKDFCAQLGIKNHYLSPRHPQANGQVEVANRSIFQMIEKKLKDKKGTWPEELPSMLWAYRTMARTPTRETPFLLTFGSEAVVLTEV
ncbi:uncharacterized protein LOC132281085 [Cornus florida]|uniref:uncharacterized protein LOC132281085 n=1 Tax=Cornus florida TaxID=4283 RepID=UPI00289B03D9|nr:uncharacterized protein LOC132281085 [Cornus florida]